jgi:hypothetical protein
VRVPVARLLNNMYPSDTAVAVDHPELVSTLKIAVADDEDVEIMSILSGHGTWDEPWIVERGLHGIAKVRVIGSAVMPFHWPVG